MNLFNRYDEKGVSIPIATWIGLFLTALLFGKSDYQCAAYHLFSDISNLNIV